MQQRVVQTETQKERIINRLSIQQTITVLIARIDKILNAQLNAILHHARFQQMEASWRGLMYLTEYAYTLNYTRLKLRVLNISWRELSKDVNNATDFDQSQLFRKIYTQEFDQPGGEPYGLLIADYYVSHRSNKQSNYNDVATLRELAKIAASSFSPMILGVDPSLLGLDHFNGLQRALDFKRTFQQPEYIQWRAFRNDEDARFIGLVLPHVLMRLPYDEQGYKKTGFNFYEDCSAENSSSYLWGNAVYCFAMVNMRTFSDNGWFADIQGVRQDCDGGGLVTNLPQHYFTQDHAKLTAVFPTDVYITDSHEKKLNDFGFISLCPCQYTSLAAFYSCPSVQIPKHYDKVIANQNARISSMLRYILCISRVSHYIKVLVRDKIGNYTSARECQRFLQEWLLQYTADRTDMTESLKAKYPLKHSKVEVTEKLGQPGNYQCTIHLRPHYQFEQIESRLYIVPELIIR